MLALLLAGIGLSLIFWWIERELARLDHALDEAFNRKRDND